MKNTKRTASLDMLDAYAKKITKKQANMLYETKMNKKYVKTIYEQEEPYSIYLDNFILEENLLTVNDITNLIAKPFKLNESNIAGGINLSTHDKSKYNKAMNKLSELGISNEILETIGDNRI